jgi:uncharacterized protein with GYD domain
VRRTSAKTYIIGVKVVKNRTDEEFAESIKRVAQVRTAHQGQLTASYVTFGRYDMIWISEYPAERAAFDAMDAIRAQGMFEYEIAEAITLKSSCASRTPEPAYRPSPAASTRHEEPRPNPTLRVSPNYGQ